MSPGSWHACGVTTDDRAWCWGLNYFGAFGNGSSGAAAGTRPVASAPALRFLQVRAGSNFTCGLTTDNRVYCWGLNDEGQLGNGGSGTIAPFTSLRARPVALRGGLFEAVLAAGGFYTCGVTTRGRGYCWGENTQGYLGDGTTTDRWTPTPIAEPN